MGLESNFVLNSLVGQVVVLVSTEFTTYIHRLVQLNLVSNSFVWSLEFHFMMIYDYRLLANLLNHTSLVFGWQNSSFYMEVFREWKDFSLLGRSWLLEINMSPPLYWIDWAYNSAAPFECSPSIISRQLLVFQEIIQVLIEGGHSYINFLCWTYGCT